MDQVARQKPAFTARDWAAGASLKARSRIAICRHGFSGARAAAPETILVVGAGLAGLAARNRLREAGKTVIVIEGRAVPGGRVRTIRNYFDDGLYAEAGPNRISDTHFYMLQC